MTIRIIEKRQRLSHLFFVCTVLLCGCSVDNDDYSERPVPYAYFDYSPKEIIFDADGGELMLSSPNVVMAFRDDSLVSVGNSLRQLYADSLANDVLRHNGAWYSIEASRTDSCNMKVTVKPNVVSQRRQERLFLLTNNLFVTRPATFGCITIIQEGKK